MTKLCIDARGCDVCVCVFVCSYARAIRRIDAFNQKTRRDTARIDDAVLAWWRFVDFLTTQCARYSIEMFRVVRFVF